MVVADHDLVILADGAPLDAADRNAAHKLIVVDGGDQHLERSVQLHLRGGNVLQNRLKQGFQVGARLLRRIGSRACPGGAEEHGGVQLLVSGVQIHQQFQHLVDDLMHPLVGAVDLVDHDDDPMSQLQGTGEDEASLGHGTLCGVHQQDDAVDHL